MCGSRLVWAPDLCDRHTLSDFAVDPGRPRRIGRSVLWAVENWPHIPAGEGWKAFVAARNELAQLFLRSAGWRRESIRNYDLIHKRQ